METLIDPYLQYYLFFQIDYDDIINYGRTSTQAQSICRSKIFWIQKAQRDFKILADNYNKAAYGFLEGNHQELFNSLKLEAPEDYNWNFTYLVTSAIQSKNDSLFYYIWELAPEDYEWDFNELIFSTTRTNNQKLF